MKAIRAAALTDIAATAAATSRLRHHVPLHATIDEVQRLLIALQPGTYVRPHWHSNTITWRGTEFIAVLTGAIGVICFNVEAQISAATQLDAGQLVEIPAGSGHTVVSLAADTVILEIKEGFAPTPDRQWFPDFPPEGDPSCRLWVRRWETHVLTLCDL
jgi:cupin fold WbuC family metalloprotein